LAQRSVDPMGIFDFLLHRLFLLHAPVGKDRGTMPFESEDEAFEFCEEIYRETGGPTPKLRQAYGFYLKNFDAGKSSATRYS
jgi:hypothetical protein